MRRSEFSGLKLCSQGNKDHFSWILLLICLMLNFLIYGEKLTFRDMLWMIAESTDI